MAINQKTKAILSILKLSFLFILLQTSICYAKNDSSDSKNSSESTKEATAEEAAPVEAAEETTDTESKEETAEIAAPESMVMSMSTSSSTSPSASGGVYSNTEAVTVSQVGSASYSYPIAVPPGRNGLQPNIALKYSSYNGNGWIGVGWDLNLVSIKRSTRDGLDYSANEFVVGGSDLVPNSAWGSNYYCKKIEGGFIKYFFNTGSNYWIAYAKDGTKYYYGQSSASRMTNTNGTYSWHLNKVVDTNGNYMTITYTKISNQIYPSQISYTGNSGLSPNKTVEFELEDRDDDTQSYSTKALVTTSKRLKTITVKVGTTTVYKYSLGYEYSPGNGRSRLAEITQVDPDNPNNTLPPTEIFWTNGGDGTFGSSSTMSLNSLPWEIGRAMTLGDINGDGMEDFIKYYTVPLVDHVYLIPFLANSSGGFTEQSLITLGAPPDANSMSVALGDINGDGKADIVSNGLNGNVYAYLSNGDGTFDSGHATPVQDGNSPIYLAELNGDGLADLVRFNSSEGKVWSHLSYGNGTFEHMGDEHLKEHLSAGGTTHLGDVNGDGISDLCILSALTIIYLGDGSGAFDTSYWGLPMGAPGLTSKGALADVNGDGLADFFINISDTTMRVYISTGTGMTGPYNTTIYGPTSIADINDDGMADVITHVASIGGKFFLKSKGDGTFYSYIFAGGSTGTNFYMADIDGNGRPDMIEYNVTSISYAYANGEDVGDHIETVKNPLGGETSITYGNNTDISNNMVPFTLHPVMDVENDDGYNVSLTTYAYSGGYYNYEERDFRGFNTVTQIRPDGTIVKTTYEQIDDYKKGVPLSIEMTAQGESTPFMETTYSWDTYQIPNTDAEFVKLTNKRVDIYDDTDVYTNEAYTYSNTHGGVLTTVASGSGGAENVTSINTYINKGSWLWRKESESITGSASGLVRQTNYTYNSLGNLLTKTYVNTTGANPVEEYTCDAYGNVDKSYDPKDNMTDYTYNSTYTRVTEIDYPTTGGVTHSVSMQYNLFGKPDQETDENNNTTYYDYDEFGRLKEVNYPDGGQTKYEYNLTASPAYIKTSVLEEGSTYVDTWQYVDGFGRALMDVSRSAGSNYVVTSQQYDEMGRSWKTEGPYFANTYAFLHTKPSVYPTSEKTFDYMGRILTVKAPKYQGSQSQFDTAYIDYDGFETTVTDADGNTRTEINDYLGRIVEVHEDPTDGGVTFYDYNAAGDLVEVEDDESNITSITYNTLGQKTSMDDPDMGVWSYTYDLNGNLYTQTDAKNQTITFLYDALNRITQKSYSTSDPAVNYYYDNLSIANGRGRLNYETNGNVTTTYNSYDEMGRVESVTKNITGDTNRTTLFTYDLSGKPVRTTYPDGFWAQNNYYNGTNLLNTVTASDGVTYASAGSYSPSGKIKTLSHGNGSSSTYTYDARTESLYEILTKNGSNATIQQRRYGYTSIGDINSINDLHNGKTYAYTYDNLSRLKTEVINGSTTSMSVSYDSLGNITSKTMNGNSFIYEYNDGIMRMLSVPSLVALRVILYTMPTAT
ncbi:MAG: FG-GAP-like repeat-containing protein [Desulfobacteraceae bacterium]|jgi:YD repeat-containing protein